MVGCIVIVGGVPVGWVGGGARVWERISRAWVFDEECDRGWCWKALSIQRAMVVLTPGMTFLMRIWCVVLCFA